MKRNILVTGGSGLIGSYFIKNYLDGFQSDKLIYPSHKDMDITQIKSIKRYFVIYEPSVVINFAAFRDASLAEKQRGDKDGSVWKVNVEGSKNIAKVCQEYNCFLIHTSTDYVFAGHKKNPGPYSEKDKPEDNDRLLSWYGITKREAERAILENLNKTSIIRICNITRPGNDPKLDYVGKILWLYDQQKIYPMFKDQYLTLVYIPTLSEIIVKLLGVGLPGIYHVSTTNLCTPFQLANYLIEKVYGRKNEIKTTSIDAFLKKNPRRYPKFGGLNAVSTQQRLNIEFKTWQETVDLFVGGEVL